MTGAIPSWAGARCRRASKPAPRYQTVRQALAAGPKYFRELMEAVGSDDGREIALELGALHQEALIDRLENGEWTLKEPG